MNKVILLGAGASRKAGYPSANELLPAIEAYSQSTTLFGPADEWSTWESFRDSDQPEILKSLLQASNPEIVLSALDLFAATQDDLTRSIFSYASDLARGENDNPEKHSKWQHNVARLNEKDAKLAEHARRALLHCLERFFIDKGREAAHIESREYLSKIFLDLGFGDTIITFNWDSIVERTLGEMHLWNPITGYGFENKRLVRKSSVLSDTVKQELLPSPVRVLKLHGSVGWKRPWLDNEQIYFDDADLLSKLPISLPDEKHPVTFVDPDFDRINHGDSVIVAPTFLKAVPAGKDMQHIWFLAGKALAEAKHVSVWGYSLPQSDGAARVLLNPLRYRLSERDVEIIVNDPSAEVRSRWDDFLGQQVSRNNRL